MESNFPSEIYILREKSRGSTVLKLILIASLLRLKESPIETGKNCMLAMKSINAMLLDASKASLNLSPAFSLKQACSQNSGYNFNWLYVFYIYFVMRPQRGIRSLRVL